MKTVTSIIAAALVFSSCNNNSIVKGYDKNWLDSIAKSSDTSYTKPYFRTDFVTATYYINNHDSTVCQVMKDSFQTVRQIILTQKGIRKYYQRFFKNGRPEATFSLDQNGQVHGPVINYYEKGTIESQGNYLHGVKTGIWESFDSSGKRISTEKFD